jgi:hypothetical protein
MPKIGGTNIVTKQSTLSKIKTKNYFGEYPKPQEYGA